MSHYVGALGNEIFVGNTKTKDGLPEYLIGLQTVRLGEQALDIDGKEIAPSYMLPLFVSRTELVKYNQIMDKRTFPGQFR